MKVVDCDRSYDFAVTERDVSAQLSTGGTDNDFHCLVSGRWVVLKLLEGQMWCADGNCPHLSDLTMDIPSTVFE